MSRPCLFSRPCLLSISSRPPLLLDDALCLGHSLFCLDQLGPAEPGYTLDRLGGQPLCYLISRREIKKICPQIFLLVQYIKNSDFSIVGPVCGDPFICEFVYLRIYSPLNISEPSRQIFCLEHSFCLDRPFFLDRAISSISSRPPLLLDDPLCLGHSLFCLDQPG